MTLFRYVPHADIQRWLSEGWVIVSDLSDCHHGQYAVLMGKPE